MLQGLALCGKCSRSMTVCYHQRFGRLTPDYRCQKNCVEQSQLACQRIPGTGIDEAIGQLLVRSVTPLALEVALNVQREIQTRWAEAERLRQQQVQRAQYEADRARVRYLRVDPNNRLVADTLEAQGNEKLRLLAQAKEECASQRRLDSAELTQEQKTQILADRLLDERTESQIATELNHRGWHTSAGRSFTMSIVHRLRRAHQLRRRPECLCAKGWLTTQQIAPEIGCKPNLVKYWRQQGLLQGIRLNDKEEYLLRAPRQRSLHRAGIGRTTRHAADHRTGPRKRAGTLSRNTSGATA